MKQNDRIKVIAAVVIFVAALGLITWQLGVFERSPRAAAAPEATEQPDEPRGGFMPAQGDPLSVQ